MLDRFIVAGAPIARNVVEKSGAPAPVENPGAPAPVENPGAPDRLRSPAHLRRLQSGAPRRLLSCDSPAPIVEAGTAQSAVCEAVPPIARFHHRPGSIATTLALAAEAARG
jgi:hypothetical protein